MTDKKRIEFDSLGSKKIDKNKIIDYFVKKI